MKAIAKRIDGAYTKYPSRLTEKNKAIEYCISANSPIEYNSSIHFLAKRTQNGNYFVKGENVLFEHFYCDFYGYVTPNMEVLRCTNEEEVDFVDTWMQSWELFPKQPIFDIKYNVEIDVVGRLYQDYLPCDLVVSFLTSTNADDQGASFLLYINRIKIYKNRMYRKNFHNRGNFMTFLWSRLESIVMPPLYLYNLSSYDLNLIRDHFSVKVIN